MSSTDLDQLAINTIRFLAVDMVEKANCGHPGAPMGQAALAYRLWTRQMRHNPADPQWPNRDRFVLSCGHASALLYSLLHLAGYGLSLDEIKNFRQLGSQTPGHPEHGLTPGVETTTGPLGQGLGNSVGMAIAQKMAAARFNRYGLQLFDYKIWTMASDGDLMEGVASEASSLAGHLCLGALNVLYDDNKISIDGPTSLAFSEDVCARYEAYGWHVLRIEDGNDLEAIDTALKACASETDRPSLVAVRTHIGYGSPNKQDTASAHGSPLGGDEVTATKQALGWPLEPTFHVPEEVLEPFRKAAKRGAEAQAEWEGLCARHREANAELASELDRRLAGSIPAECWSDLPVFTADDGPIATRSASGRVLNAIAPHLPELVGGSADLTPSNNTFLADKGDFSSRDPESPNIRFGVREHAMGSIMNGLALSGKFVPYGGTFLVFADYMRPAVRLAALMEQRAIFIFTHDSIFLGEDGPTHQPVSHLAGLRAIPNLTVVRPADARETAAAWRVALERSEGPTALALTRQKLPVLDETAEAAARGVPRGAYVLADSTTDLQLLLIATGSEVALAIGAREALEAEGIGTRVVSMPSWELFAAQDEAYRNSVLPPEAKARFAVEAGARLGWERWIGDAGDALTVDRFGASAPYAQMAEAYGFTVDEVVRRARSLVST